MSRRRGLLAGAWRRRGTLAAAVARRRAPRRPRPMGERQGAVIARRSARSRAEQMRAAPRSPPCFVPRKRAAGATEIRSPVAGPLRVLCSQPPCSPSRPVWRRSLLPSEPGLECGKVSPNGHAVWVNRPERLFANRQRAAIERLRLSKAIRAYEQSGEIVAAVCDVQMLRPETMFADGQRAALKRLGLVGPFRRFEQ